MAEKALKDIKHSDRILEVLKKPRMLQQVANLTSIDVKTVQRSLTQLSKGGYIAKDSAGLWLSNVH